ncbi:MAG TPA: HAD-IA family hydrolase, partial [Kineosporiaceae bacterium]|nr:HAD-IA family hydrolase [Kineosporiaceae bacterium]
MSVLADLPAVVPSLRLRPVPVAAPGLLGRMLAGLAELDAGMLGIVRRAHAAGVRTALLSNSWGDHYPDELFDGLFDAVVISGRVGMRKPDAEIFRHTAELLGLEPAECVMVDDL